MVQYEQIIQLMETYVRLMKHQSCAVNSEFSSEHIGFFFLFEQLSKE